MVEKEKYFTSWSTLHTNQAGKTAPDAQVTNGLSAYYQAAKKGGQYDGWSPRSLHDLGHAAPGVVVVVAHQPALSLDADELEQAAGRPRVLGGDHIRCSQDIDRSALSDFEGRTGREVQAASGALGGGACIHTAYV